MIRLLAAAVAMLLLAPHLMAQNFTAEEQEAWSALETQLEHVYAAEWDEVGGFLHPDVVFWDPENPVPYPVTESSLALGQLAFGRTGNVLGHELTPVSVVVDGDVAIINFYVRYLLEADPGGAVEWVSWRGHNTWKKRGNRWLLLATYNTTESEG